MAGKQTLVPFKLFILTKMEPFFFPPLPSKAVAAVPVECSVLDFYTE